MRALDLPRNLIIALLCLLPAAAWAEEAAAPADAAAAANATPEQKAFLAKLAALNWVKGPTTVSVAGNSKLAVPESYLYLDQANTSKFLELNQNIASGKEVMVAPRDLSWAAYLAFDAAGYVKDTEKIDGAALLKTLKDNTEAENSERKNRGWAELHIVDWAVPPAYNQATRRLEWATTLQSGGRSDVNFFTKILGRRGYTSVVMVTDPGDLGNAEQALDTVLNGYSYNSGDTYAEWKQGDKVAEYGLAALILGGAAAVATKKGLWTVLAGFFAAGWKIIVAGAVGVSAWFRSRFKPKA